jgi:predicted TIM-barrel fold metal-dependent hydrolase
VGEVLDAHLAASPRFRGIRHAAGWDASDQVRNSHTNPPPGLLAQARFRQGFAELARRGLTFDAWLYHPQIPELTSLAQAFPATTIVLDHLGGPLGIGPYEGRRAEILVQWKKAIGELARCPNVVAKLGGLVMPINGLGFHRRERPATSSELVHAIDCFGPERAMFESNFPVDKASCSYHVLWNAFKRLAAGFTEADRRALFHDTAARVYRLRPPGGAART